MTGTAREEVYGKFLDVKLLSNESSCDKRNESI